MPGGWDEKQCGLRGLQLSNRRLEGRRGRRKGGGEREGGSLENTKFQG